MAPTAAQKIHAEDPRPRENKRTGAKLFVFPAGRAFKEKTLALYILLIAANVGAWVWAFVAFRDYPLLLGTAVLAYSFGLRHAVDADHIAAIDNVTRKLMNEGKRP